MRYLAAIGNRVAFCSHVISILSILSWTAYPLNAYAQTGDAVSSSAIDKEKTIIPIQDRAWRSRTRRPKAVSGKYLQLSRPQLGFGASYEFTEERKTIAENETTVINHEFNEWLEAGVDGSIYHPALLSFSQDLKLEWRQMESERDEEESTSLDGYLVGYDTRVSVLKDKPYTLNLYTMRTQDTYSSPFASRTRTETDQYGADLAFKYRILPTHLSYSHSQTEQEGFFTSTDEYDTLELQTTYGGFVYKGSREERMRTTDESFQSNVDRTEHQLRGNHYLTADEHLRLTSLLSHRRTDGDTVDYTTVNATERLMWKHYKSLESDYEIHYQHSNWDETESTLRSIRARLTHLLYENLVTRLSGRYSENEFDQDCETTYGGLLDLGYNRTIPAGRLHINMQNDYQVITRDITEAYAQISEEPQQLTTGEVTLLNRQDVDNDTVVVTNSAGTIIYIENIDYQVSTIGNSTRISRLQFGAIPDGGSVLVSYQYLTNPAYDSSIHTQSYHARVFLWSALTLSLRYSSSDERVLSGIAPEEESDSQTWGAGLNWVWRWTETSIDFDDATVESGISTRRWRVEESLSFRPTRAVFFNIRGQYTNTDFKESDETEDAYGLLLNLNWQPVRWWKFDLQGSWLEVSGSFEESINWELAAGITLSYRIWHGSLKYRIIDNEDRISGDQRSEHRIYAELIRRKW